MDKDNKEVKNKNYSLEEIKEVALAAIFLALCGLTSIFEIPLPFLASFLALNLSLIFLVVARRSVKLGYAIIIAAFYPLFTFLSPISGGIVGVMVLADQAIVIVLLDYLLFDKLFPSNVKNSIKVGVTIGYALATVSITTAWCIFMNVIVFYPLFGYAFWNAPDPLGMIKTIIVEGLAFNFLKIGLSYALGIILSQGIQLIYNIKK